MDGWNVGILWNAIIIWKAYRGYLPGEYVKTVYAFLKLIGLGLPAWGHIYLEFTDHSQLNCLAS